MANFNRKVTIYTNTPTPNGSGGFKANWDAGVVKWADIDVVMDKSLFVDGQEFNTGYYVLQLNGLSFDYTAPVENYKIVVNAFGINRTLKIVSARQPDLLSYIVVLQCIESNS